jgi:hypothetical protein
MKSDGGVFGGLNHPAPSGSGPEGSLPESDGFYGGEGGEGFCGLDHAGPNDADGGQNGAEPGSGGSYGESPDPGRGGAPPDMANTISSQTWGCVAEQRDNIASTVASAMAVGAALGVGTGPGVFGAAAIGGAGAAVERGYDAYDGCKDQAHAAWLNAHPPQAGGIAAAANTVGEATANADAQANTGKQGAEGQNDGAPTPTDGFCALDPAAGDGFCSLDPAAESGAGDGFCSLDPAAESGAGDGFCSLDPAAESGAGDGFCSLDPAGQGTGAADGFYSPDVPAAQAGGGVGFYSYDEPNSRAGSNDGNLTEPSGTDGAESDDYGQ